MTDINVWLHNTSAVVGIYYISQNRPGSANAEVINNLKTLRDLNNKISFFLMRDMPMSICLGSAPN